MIRNDIVRMYREIHTWVGISCGLFLFIAFYAGAISMFEVPLQRWASPPIESQSLTPLRDTQALIDKVIFDYPTAERNFNIVLQPGPEAPARMHWTQREAGADDHAHATNYYADLTPAGELIVRQETPSGVAQMIDDLHQQVGILIDHELAMPITGIVSMLYGLALISGLMVLLPTLAKDLFALRLEKKPKRMWLDIHNLIGVFSLPFHLIMALTALVFACHDYFYSAQETSIYPENSAVVSGPPTAQAPTPGATYYPISALLSDLEQEAPDFQPELLNYRLGRGPDGGKMLLVSGTNPKHHGHRPRHGIVSLNPYTGSILSTDYMPGRQQPLQATVSSFFALHFGNFGGELTRWLYLILGLAGAFLFYSGNLLWIEVRRKRSRQSHLTQSRSSRILGSLTVGVSLGCMSGISAAIANAKFSPIVFGDIFISDATLYYCVFFAAIGWALLRGSAKSAAPLLYITAFFTALIPVASIIAEITSTGWNHDDNTVWIDLIAVLASLSLIHMARKTHQRAVGGSVSSVWSAAT